ncbi:MAG: acyltransferase family protein [Actinomycetota bacterium]|nr:acyltransferase family protein [Actinomycetota bacterium]
MSYRPDIDGLRAVAVLAVVLNHAGFGLLPGGFLGVDVFFVISGFLITGIIEREFSSGSFSLVGFYERRVRRILPALGVVIVAVTPAAWTILTPAQLKQYGQSVASVAVFSSNLLFWQQSGYFDVAAELKPLLHTWSLAVEEQFYLVFPLLLVVLLRLGKRARGIALSSLIIGSLVFAQVGASAQWTSNFYLLPSRAWELLLGAALALLGVRAGPGSAGRAREAVSFLALIALVGSLVFLTQHDPLPGVLSLVPVGATVALLWSSGPETLAYRVLTLKPLVTVGLMSYSIYLWHQPLFVLARHATRSDLGASLAAILVGVTLALSAITYRFVERPFRRKHWLSRQRIFLLGAILSAGLLAFGAAAQISGGNLPGKADAAAREAQLALMTEPPTPPRPGSPCHWQDWTPVEPYLGGWNCGVGSDADLEPANAIVVGDSHAGVFAGAFLRNGLSPARASGNGCSILRPDAASYPECTAILDLAIEEIKKKGIGTAYLVNYYQENELTELFLQRSTDFWLQYVDEVVLMAPVPEFPTAHATYVNSGEIELTADFSKADQFMSIVRDMEMPSSVIVIDTARLLCGVERHCRFIEGDDVLWLDADHLSGQGARRLGTAMLEEGLIKRDER